MLGSERKHMRFLPDCGKCDRKFCDWVMTKRLGDDKGRAWRSVQIQPLRSDENQLCNEFNVLNSLATIR